jgi:hypothetical protein
VRPTWASKVAAPAALSAALLLAACSSTGKATGTTTSAPAPSGVGTTLAFSLARNARQDVTTGSCIKTGGTWNLTGTVENSAPKARNYQIVVDFVDPSGNTVLDTKIVTTATVKHGARVPWSARSTPGLADVACVIRQVQAPA